MAAHALVLMETKSRTADNRAISFKKSDYIETCKFISSIFKHEFPNRVDLDTARIEKTLVTGIKAGYIAVEGETIIIQNKSKNAFRKVRLMLDLLQSFIDSYHIVLLSLQYIMEKGSIIQKQYMV